MYSSVSHFTFFFFNDTATTEIYTLSLHDALPICEPHHARFFVAEPASNVERFFIRAEQRIDMQSMRLPAERSEEHTSELQSLAYLVCRLLLEKKKKTIHQFNS